MKSLYAASALFLFATAIAHAAQLEPPKPPPNPAAHPLVWDTMQKIAKIELGPTNIDFTFWVTNTAKTNVMIQSLQPSCGCTRAQMPSQPWNIEPGKHGPVHVSVDLMGKIGDVTKFVTVNSPAGQQTLTLKITIPETPESIKRHEGMMMSRGDRQIVFRGDCAACHVKKGEGKQGAELFAADCGICHDAAHRAQMVPDLSKLKHPTNAEFWKQMISEGKDRTLMPAFAKSKGGPLSDEQIDSLVAYALQKYPSMGAPAGGGK
jgi:mono/diheme cytochrome c family protein